MSRSVEAFKVFIASPGDLEKERTAVRDEIRTFTDSYMHEYGAAFSSEGWEDVPGGLRRAQAAINEVVESCDYMILILGSRWGTPPDKDKNYTSGTEEEFHLAKKCIEGADSPMRDVLVLFKGIPDAQLGDPGPQLKRVLKFKAELERSKEILYKTFDDLESLRHEVRSRLRGWAQPPGGLAAGQAGEPDDRPLGQTGSTSPAAPTDQGLTELESEASPLEVAAQYEAKGQVTQAEAAYARAIVDLDVPSLEKYARFLRRTSRLSKSLEVNREILNQLASTRDPRQTTAERARVLTSIGIVERKLGNLIASRRSLQEAIQTAREGAPETVEALAYALDNLGITVDRSGDSEEAIALFTEALEARRGSGELAGQARSLTNLARVLKRHGDVEEAERSCRRAIELLNELDDRPALASAHAAMGEILDLKGALPPRCAPEEDGSRCRGCSISGKSAVPR